MDADVDIVLSANDSVNQSSKSKTSCRVVHKHLKLSADEVSGATIIEKFYIIAHFGKSDIISNQLQFFEHIKSRIKPNSKVTISGFADRTGTTQINRNLATKRVEQVQDVLQVSADKLIRNPVGSDILLYDNDLPQGRCYSRTIQVVVETYIP
jgi:hypothetical protein